MILQTKVEAMILPTGRISILEIQNQTRTEEKAAGSHGGVQGVVVKGRAGARKVGALGGETGALKVSSGALAGGSREGAGSLKE